MKRCSKCGEEKALSEYGRDAARPGGHKNQCKPCCAAYLRDLRRRKPKLFSGYDATKYKRHRESILERNRKRSRKLYHQDLNESRRKAREARKRYYRPEVERQINAAQRANLSNGYVASKIGLPLSQAPGPLIEAKRVQLQIHRLLKEINK